MLMIRATLKRLCMYALMLLLFLGFMLLPNKSWSQN